MSEWDVGFHGITVDSWRITWKGKGDGKWCGADFGVNFELNLKDPTSSHQSIQLGLEVGANGKFLKENGWWKAVRCEFAA